MSKGSPKPSDKELIAAILDGDQEQFSELVQRYQARLVNFLYRLLHDLADAHLLCLERRTGLST